MKKSISLFLLLLSSVTIFSQMETTNVPITGLGDFVIRMTPEELSESLAPCMSSDSEISGIFDGESSIIVTNLKSMGYVFDWTAFSFSDNELKSISFSMNFDKKNKNPKEFEELFAMFENDYGVQNRKADSTSKKIIAYVWRNEDDRSVMLSKDTSKKHPQIIITAYKSIFDRGNDEVYKYK